MPGRGRTLRGTRVAAVLLFLAVAACAWPQQYVISTFAGGGTVPDHVRATTLSIDWSGKALAVDAAGTIWFTSLNCVFKLDRDGIVTRIAGTWPRRLLRRRRGPAERAVLLGPGCRIAPIHRLPSARACGGQRRERLRRR